jgi:hypothetical protein
VVAAVVVRLSEAAQVVQVVAVQVAAQPLVLLDHQILVEAVAVVQAHRPTVVLVAQAL